MKKIFELKKSGEATDEKTKLFNAIRQNVGVLDQAFQHEYFHHGSLHYVNDLAEIDYQPARELALQFIERHLSEIRTKLTDAPQEKQGNYLNAVSKLVKYGENEQKIKGIPILVNNLNKIQDGLGMEDFVRDEYVSVLQAMMGSGNISLSQSANDIIRQYIKKPDIPVYTPTPQLLSDLLKSDNEEVKSQVFIAVSEFVNKYGLDMDILYNAWRYGNPDFSDSVRENLSVISRLENQRPGASVLLLREFGIKNFGRYDVDLLIRQYDEFEKTDMPYGIVINPEGDWNGALFNFHKYLLSSVSDSLHDKYALRITECKSKIDIARTLIKLKRRYGDKHKISFAIIGGHGAEDRILFGGEYDEQHTLLAADLLGKGAQRVNEFFEPDPTIILDSCSTGAEGGIGQDLAKTIGAKVIAPDIPTSIGIINTTIDNDGKLNFKVRYTDESASKTFDGTKNNTREVEK